MLNIIVTAMDMNPSVIPIWKQTWDILKSRHPLLRVTVFTVPLWKGRSQNDIFQNKEFKKWYKERKSWVEIQQQGYKNINPPECKRFRKPQHAILKRGFRKILTYLPDDCYVFKPPFDQMDNNTLGILSSLGFSACIRYKGLILLRPTFNQLPPYKIISSRINIDEKTPDDIQKLWKMLDVEFSTFESKGYEFSTLSELLKNNMLEDE